MALITTLNEVKAVLPKLVSNLTDASLLPNFDTAEMKYLMPIIGMELYDDIVTKYSADPQTLSAEEQKFLKHAQLLIASNAFRDEMIINQVMWTDQGLRTMTTQDLGKPVGWEFKELKAFFESKSCDAQEVLLSYLWANKVSYPLWTASDEYTKFTELLIRTGMEFNDMVMMYQPMRTYYMLQSVVRDVQDEYIAAGVGQDLLKYLRDVEAPTDDEKECTRLLKKSMAFFTVKHAAMMNIVRLSEAGLTTVTMMRPGDSENSDTAGRSGADMKMTDEFKKMNDFEGQNYLSKARYMLYVYRNGGTSGADFNSAFDKGPLVGYVKPGDRTSGNGERKIFVL
jgi:hypothetical protein